MSTVFKLFKLQIDEIYNIFKVKNIKKLLFSIAKYVFIILLLMLGLYMILKNIFLLGFKINKELVSIVLLATQIVSLFFAVGNIISTLFLSKNNELLLSLPASANQIFMSKIMVIYIQEVVINSLFTLPVLLALGWLGSMPSVYFAMLPLLMLILPILPLAIGALASIPVMKFLKFLKSHVALYTTFIFALVGVGIYLYINVLSIFATSFNILEKQIQTIRGINAWVVEFAKNNLIFNQLSQAMLDVNKIYYIGMYLLIAVAFLLLAYFIIKPFYFKVAMESHENKVPQKVKKKKFVITSPFLSLLKKEFLTVFRSPGYVFQYFIFTLLMPVIVVLYDKLLLMLVVNQTGQIMIAGSHILIVGVLAMLSNIISASAISREGGNFYLIKTAPVNYYVQTLAKVVFNTIFTVGAVLVTAIVTFFYLDAVVVILSTLAVLFMSIAHICLSFDLDLKNPTLDWYDTGEISQINNNTKKSILWGLLLAGFMGLFIMTFSVLDQPALSWVLLVILSMAFCVYRIYILILRVFYKYDKIEM